jgi:hypothetical protein
MILNSAVADPGCLKVIQGKAIDENTAALLPPDCKEFRKSYLQGLKLLSQNPNEFSHELSKQILAKKSFEPPYNALLLSVLAHEQTDELKQAIIARAKIETAKKFKYKYALAVKERIEKGGCTAQFSTAFYHEICFGKDLAYTRIEKLQAARSAVKQ